MFATMRAEHPAAGFSGRMGSMRNARQLMNPLTFREKRSLLNSICVYLIIQREEGGKQRRLRRWE